MGTSDSRERVTNISRSYSGKKEDRKATMVSKLEYVDEHSMTFFKEKTEHTGYRHVEIFFTYFFSIFYFLFITSLKIFLLYGNILTIFISKLKSLAVLNHIQKISFL